MSSKEGPYNPLDKFNLGASVTEALLAREAVSLGSLKPFLGAGIYAIYYLGTFPPYAVISNANRNGRLSMPIYVGKAIPAGGRKGRVALDATPGQVLFNRLREHADSIQQAENIDLADFACRFLVVDDIWIPLGESLLITRSRPLWNQVLDGFGNHDPGSGRGAQRRSRWDVIHPGRAWATRLAENKQSKDALLERIARFLDASASHREPGTSHPL